MSSINISNIPHLSAERWQNARQRAAETVRASVPAPDKKHYASQGAGNTHGKLFYAMLAVVMVAAFWISAGKQIVGAATLIDPLTSQARLSSGWGDWAIALTLAFGELGSLAFMIALGSAASLTKQRIFASFAVLCAAVALVANISVTAPHINQAFLVFDGLMTILPPLTVLGVGLIIEDDLMKSARARARQDAAYQAALDEYQRVQARPEDTPGWKHIWGQAVYDELCRQNRRKRELFEALPESDKFALVSREYHKHMLWERYEVAPPRLGESSEVAPPRLIADTGADMSRTGNGQDADIGADNPRTAVRAYLATHPEAASFSVRKLGEAARVSKTIAAEVLKEWKS